MGGFKVGQVVSSIFPFSDLKTQKYRPTLILAIVDFNDLMLCQITSKPYTSSVAIELLKSDFVSGGLPIVSYIRPDKLFTTDTSIVSKIYGELKPEKLQQVQNSLIDIFTKHG